MKSKLKVVLRTVLAIVCLCMLNSCAFYNYTYKEISFAYRGSWSSWFSFGDYTYGSNIPAWAMGLNVFRAYDCSGIGLKSSGGTEILYVHINNFVMPDKKTRKARYKNGISWQYTGTVEYYVNDQYPTAEALARANRLVVPNPRTDQTPCVKRRATCTIRIKPYKDTPEVWYVFFDNIGIGIDIRGVKFMK